MGIQINGQIDDISATDGGLTISDLEINQSGISTFNGSVIINEKIRINPDDASTTWQRENKNLHQIRDDVYVEGTVNLGDKAGFDATPLGITTFAYTGIGTTGELTVGIATTTHTPTAHAIAEGKNILIKDSASGFQEAYNTLTGSTGLTIKVRRAEDPSTQLSIANTKVVVYTPADPRGCLNVAKDFAKFEQNTFNPILRGFVGASTTHPVGINTEVFKIELKRDSSTQDSVATLLHSTREMGSKQRLALTIDDGDSYPDGKSLVLTQTGVKITNLDDFTNAKTLLEVQDDAGGTLTLSCSDDSSSADQLIGKINFHTADPSGDGPQNNAIISAHSVANTGSGAYIKFSTATGATGSEGADAVERVRIASDGAFTLKPEGDVAEAIRIAPAVDASTQQEFGIGLAVNSSHTHPAAKITFKEYDASDSRGDLLFYTRGANSDSAPTERLRITSGGDLRLGLNSVAEQTDSAHYIMTLTGKSGQTGAGAIAFRDPSANTDGFIFADGGNLFITADYSNATADSSIRFRVDGSSEKLRISANTLQFNSTAQQIHLATSDGSDNGYLNIGAAGGANNQNRGAQVVFYGNEYSGAEGRCGLLAGNSGNSNGYIYFQTGGSERLRITSSGGTIINKGGTINTASGWAGLEVKAGSSEHQLVLSSTATASNSNYAKLGFKLHPSNDNERAKAAIVCQGNGGGYGEASRMMFCLDAIADNGSAEANSDDERFRISPTTGVDVRRDKFGWSTFGHYTGSSRTLLRHVKEFGTGSSSAVFNLIRVRRHYWGWGHYKITIKRGYYSGIAEDVYYLNGHGRDDGSYNPSYSIGQRQYGGDGSNFGYSNRITITSPSTSSPGSSYAAYVDVQLQCPAYMYFQVEVEGYSSAYSTDYTSLASDQYALM